MKFDKIVGFGDSWIYGDELLDPELVKVDPTAHTCYTQNDQYRNNHCFLGRLGQHYGVPVENFGIPGGSHQSALWTYLWWTEHETIPLDRCLVIIGHTDSNRYSFYNPRHVSYGEDPPWNKFVHSKWVEFGSSMVPDSFRSMIKQFLVVSDCTELSKLNYRQNVMFFDGQAAQGIPTIQVNVGPPLMSVKSKNFMLDNSCLVNFLSTRPGLAPTDLFMPHRHPNEFGHQLIANQFVNWIKQRYLF